jgi:biofilm protein TabA
MIVDHISNAWRYSNLHPGFQGAFDFLKTADLSKEFEGREIDGQRLMLRVTQAPGKGHEGARLETHRDYIDIQYGFRGMDEIGWKAACELAQPDGQYDSAHDVRFYNDKPSAWLPIGPGYFAVFFPEDAHAPLGGTGDLHKIIMKIRLQ